MTRRPFRGFWMLSLSLALMLTGITLTPSAASAFSGFAIITGSVQGSIQGDNTTKICAGCVTVLQVGVGGTIPTSTTGGVTGAPQYTSFQLAKNPDKATVKLLRAFRTLEKLTVEIRLYRPDVTGADVLFHTIVLQNAFVSDFNLGGAPNSGPLTEFVSFSYDTIKFIDLTGATTILP